MTREFCASWKNIKRSTLKMGTDCSSIFTQKIGQACKLMNPTQISPNLLIKWNHRPNPKNLEFNGSSKYWALTRVPITVYSSHLLPFFHQNDLFWWIFDNFIHLKYFSHRFEPLNSDFQYETGSSLWNLRRFP